MNLRTVRADDGPLLQRLTLQSVEDAPYAFGGVETLEEERQRPAEAWSDLAAESAGLVDAWRDKCIAYIVMDGEVACGKAIVFVSPKVPTHVYMSGVWIDAAHRRRGMGRQIVAETRAWAAARGADRLRLWVDDANAVGVAFYLANGFVPVGKSRPVRPGASESESLFEWVFGVTDEIAADSIGP